MRVTCRKPTDTEVMAYRLSLHPRELAAIASSEATLLERLKREGPPRRLKVDPNPSP
jgi:hypothetical protein